MNLRPSGYEPDELPDCSTPQPIEFPKFSWRFYLPLLRSVSRASPSEGRQSYPLRHRLQGLLLQRGAQLRGEMCRFLLIQSSRHPAETETFAMPRLGNDVEMHVVDGLVGA